MIPAAIDPATPSPGERDAFQRLKSDPLAGDWTVIHSLYLPNHVRQISGELDFVLLIPEKGILCLEIKAAASISRREGLWFYGKEPKGDPRGPFLQASEGMHSLRQRVEKRLSTASKILFWSAVCLPYTSLDFKAEEWHRWQLIDSVAYRAQSLAASCLQVLDRASEFLREKETARWFDPEAGSPSKAECDEIARILRPDFEAYQSPKARRQQVSVELKRYTEEQFGALDAMTANPRVVFEGPAGTGKTLLAIESAQRAVSAGKRVLFVCFNRLLGSWLRRETDGLGESLVSGTLHSFMLQVAGLREAPGDSASFWQEELPGLALERLLAAEGPQPFDVLVVDEAQDLLDDRYLDVLDMSLKGGLASGEWRLFGDFERQAIYSDGAAVLGGFLSGRGHGAPVYRLRTNCRNKPRVATLVRVLSHLDPDYLRVLRPDDGVEPSFRFYVDDGSGPDALIAVLAELFEERYRGSDIVVLSPRASGSCAERVAAAPWRDRLRPMPRVGTGHIAYGTIHAFKGMEAPVVIVTDLDDVAGPAAEALLYISVTRPTERLVLLIPELARAGMQRLLSGSREEARARA
jgi:DNA replication protein DnaC